MAGNTAADVRAGGAWYELWGKDNLSAVLDKAKRNAESFGGAMKKVGSKAKAGAEAALGGIKGGLQGLGAEVGAELLKGLGGYLAGLEKLQKEYEKATRAIARANMLGDINMQRRGEMIEAQVDGSKKRAAIEKEINKLLDEQSQQRGIRDQFTVAKDHTGVFKEEATLGERGQALALWWLGGLEDAQNNIQQQIDNANDQLDATYRRIEELSTQRGRLMKADNDPAKQKAVEELTRELKEQAKTWGMAADEIKRYQLNRDSFSNDQIDTVKKAQDSLKRVETIGSAAAAIYDASSGKATELAAELKTVTEALQKQADTWGMTAEQITLYELKAKGFTDDLLGGVNKNLAVIKMHEVLDGAAAALAQGVAAADNRTIASLGSFSGADAAQRFGSDTLTQKSMKAAEDTAKNTAATVKAVTQLAQGLKFQ